MRTKLFCRTVISASIVSLFGCGGGDSNTASAPTTAAPSTTISGTAASGAPFAGATVTLTDANGTQRSATAASDGRFTLDASGLTAPFALNATGTVSDAPTTLIAVSAEGPKEGERKTLNVTPLTTAVAALLSDNNDPLDLTDPAKLKAKATPAQIQAIVAALRSILGEVVASTGASASTFDPMTTAFNADRTGLDAVLDAIKVSLSDRGVELTMRLSRSPKTAATRPARQVLPWCSPKHTWPIRPHRLPRPRSRSPPSPPSSIPGATRSMRVLRNRRPTASPLMAMVWSPGSKVRARR
jgi:hypothetical protein